MKVIKAEYRDSVVLYVCAPHGVVCFSSVEMLRIALHFDTTLSWYTTLITVRPNKPSILKWIKPRKAKVSVLHV